MLVTKHVIAKEMAQKTIVDIDGVLFNKLGRFLSRFFIPILEAPASMRSTFGAAFERERSILDHVDF